MEPLQNTPQTEIQQFPTAALPKNSKSLPRLIGPCCAGPSPSLPVTSEVLHRFDKLMSNMRHHIHNASSQRGLKATFLSRLMQEALSVTLRLRLLQGISVKLDCELSEPQQRYVT